MLALILPLAMPLTRAPARGTRARGVRWIVMVWCLLFTVSVFSATHFPDGQAADDALEAIEAVIDDALSNGPQATVSNAAFEHALKVAVGKPVKQPGQCFDASQWAAQAPDAPSNAATADHPSDAPELWLPPSAMPLAPVLRVARARLALPPFQVGPAPAPLLRPPARV